MLEHTDLIKELNWCIDEAFSDAKPYLTLKKITNGKTEAFFTDKNDKKSLNITANELKHMVKYLIDNIYIQCGDKIFRQTIGIPMGTNCAPFLANLYLFAK